MAGQNTSSAVMQQRFEPAHSLDYFPTPPWATRALCRLLEAQGQALHLMRALEPACGAGHMAMPLSESFDEVIATDVQDFRSAFPDQKAVCDFTIDPAFLDDRIDWVVTNPPFRLAEDFIRMALSHARVGVAMLVRTSFLEGKARFAGLFRETPPAIVAQLVERVPMVKGRLDQGASTATSYCWLIWYVMPPGDGTRFEWIAPCRRALEREGDYPRAVAAAPADGDAEWWMP